MAVILAKKTVNVEYQNSLTIAWILASMKDFTKTDSPTLINCGRIAK